MSGVTLNAGLEVPGSIQLLDASRDRRSILAAGDSFLSGIGAAGNHFVGSAKLGPSTVIAYTPSTAASTAT
jgi:hypothetical protein